MWFSRKIAALIVTLTITTTAQAFVLDGRKWGSPVLGTSGGVVTWSLAAGPYPTSEGGGGLITPLAGSMPVGFKAEIVAAFAQWSAVADITFVEVPDSGDPWNSGSPTETGMIRIGMEVLDGVGGTLAHGYFPPPNGTTAAGDIHFDIAETWGLGLVGPGFSIRQVMAHEIGHAIGLRHVTGVTALMNPFYTEAFDGVQADDIAGAIAIYGAASTGPPGGSGVPEPASILVWALGLGFVGLRYRRKRAA